MPPGRGAALKVQSQRLDRDCAVAERAPLVYALPILALTKCNENLLCTLWQRSRIKAYKVLVIVSHGSF